MVSKSFNQGQICVSTDYVLCHDSVSKELIQNLKKYSKELFGRDSSLFLRGRVINEKHYERLCSYFKDHGGEVIMGNENAHNDKYLQFSIILNPDKKSALMRDEIFGPILPILTYNNIDEAINYI